LAENVAEADAWRTAGGSVEEKMAAFRTALQSTELFLEANNSSGGSGGSSNVPSFATTGAMESVMGLVRGDLTALRVVLLELERMHQLYDCVSPRSQLCLSRSAFVSPVHRL
jgi:hypothetical protein